MKLIEVAVSQLTGGDVGARAVATQDGVAFDGVLTEVDVTRSDYIFKATPQITARLVLKTFGAKPKFSTSEKPTAEIQLRDLPLDYLIQIERADD